MDYRLEIAQEYYATTARRSGKRDMEALDRYARFLEHKITDWLPLEKDSPVLDLACGCGEILWFLKRQGFLKISGIDLCQEELEICRSLGFTDVKNADVRQALKDHRNEFQLITAFNLLEHLLKQEVVDLLKDIHAALRPGGRLMALVPNAHSPLGLQARYWDFTHETAFSTNSWEQLAALVGFERPQFRELSPYPHGPISLARSALWQILRGIIALYNLIETASPRGGIYTQDMFVLLKKPG